RQSGGASHNLGADEGLCPFDRTAVAGMIDYRVRLADRRNKVTSRFVDLADLAREACYVARQAGETPVTAAHLRIAREARTERHNLIETKIREMIAEGTLLIDTEGTQTGQVNGLSLMESGGHLFGKPVRL